MENLIKQIEKETGVSNLNRMTWLEIVDNVILPQMAGPRKTRWCINDMFLNFVANNVYALEVTDKDSLTVMLEIGLQRLSCGAVLHEATPWPEPLPQKYWDYSSKWDEGHIMTEGCYNFIIKAMETCLKNETTKSHALKILFGLINHISPDGTFDYHAFNKVKDKIINLYTYAERLVEKYATFEELYRNYATPGQWQKHRIWFANHYARIPWKKFFEDTKCVKGNFIQKFRQRNTIKKNLKRISLPQVM